MTQMASKLVEVVSALETLEYPYVLYREESGAHRILVEASSKAAVQDSLAKALAPEVFRGIEITAAEDDDETAEVVRSRAGGTNIVIEVQPGTDKSAASMLWWLALQEGSKAARAIAHGATPS